MSKLLLSRRFLPLFLCQFLGAFNDNLFKNALVILITYVIAAKAGLNPQLTVTIAAGLFILPYFLFSATAGKMADKYEKSRLIRTIKLIEIILMIGATVGFYLSNIWLLLTILFLMGTHSTFFGPLKYSILPDHLEDHELIRGNALIEAGTFLAILFGTISGGLLILAENGTQLISVMVIATAVTGWLTSRAIPKAGPVAPNLRLHWNIVAESWDIVAKSRRRSDVFLSIIGISWFWFVGATFLAQFPTYVKDIIQADEQVVTLFLGVFSIGIGIGSILCNLLLRNRVSGDFAAPAALGMGVLTLLLYGATLLYQDAIAAHIAQKTPEFFARNSFPFARPGELIGLAEFLLIGPASWMILAMLALIAVCSGIYIVPLYAIMQSRTAKSECSQVVAANNILNALFMVSSALFSLALLAMQWSLTEVFLLMGFLNLPIAVIVRKIVRHEQAKQREVAADA